MYRKAYREYNSENYVHRWSGAMEEQLLELARKLGCMQCSY